MSSTTKFDFTSTHKRNFIILFVIGMMAVLTGVFTGQADAQKTWANLLVNAVFLPAYQPWLFFPGGSPDRICRMACAG